MERGKMPSVHKPLTLERVAKRITVLELAVTLLVRQNKQLRVQVDDLQGRLDEIEIRTYQDNQLIPFGQQLAPLNAANLLGMSPPIVGDGATSSDQWAQLFATVEGGRADQDQEPPSPFDPVNLVDLTLASPPHYTASANVAVDSLNTGLVIPQRQSVAEAENQQVAGMAADSSHPLHVHTQLIGAYDDDNVYNPLAFAGAHSLSTIQQHPPITTTTTHIDPDIANIDTPSLELIKQQQMLLDFYSGSASRSQRDLTGSSATYHQDESTFALSFANAPTVLPTSGLWTTYTDSVIPIGNNKNIINNNNSSSTVRISNNISSPAIDDNKTQGKLKRKRMRRSSMYPSWYDPAPVAWTNLADLMHAGQLTMQPDSFATTLASSAPDPAPSTHLALIGGDITIPTLPLQATVPATSSTTTGNTTTTTTTTTPSIIVASRTMASEISSPSLSSCSSSQ